jgi:hypothetical protein
LYGESAYTDYRLEDIDLEKKGVVLKIQRKWNAKRNDTLEQRNQKLKIGKRIETTISDIKKNVTKDNTCSYIVGIPNKLTLFIFGISIK